MTDGALTPRLVAFAREASWEDMPVETQATVRRTVGNAVALAVGSARLPAVELAIRTLRTLGSRGQSTVLGRAEGMSLLHAPIVNGIAIHAEDFDDTHLPTVLHPAAPIVPAALAMAEEREADGRAFMTAVAVGVEVAIRVGNSICPEHFDRGWHVTGTVGHLGAAVAAGRLAGLDSQQMTVAVGLAATQAAGLTAALGTMTKPLHAGKAAGDGVDAALLAEQGFSGPPHPIEGRRGLAALASDRFEPGQALDGLGVRWELDDNAVKPYACGIVSHPIIDAGIELAKQADAHEAQRFRVLVNPVVLEVMGTEDPRSGLASKFSAYHAFAVGFVDGTGGISQFGDECAVAPDIVDVRRRVEIETDRAVPKGAATVHALRDGAVVATTTIDHATGSVEHPMTDDQVREKAVGLVEPILGSRTSALVERAFAVDAFGVADLLAAARVGERPA